eukprot:CAMPEP_0202689708 /NCGR_PEP_ID=MMETSP1385-20130828/4911_1 /ASSEMBLY_ACC=CAM_ASM_000861 /TAXON_ID=933848 /ORGANISM="Elphidium margaritaceum" /LENGTH=360 /DNA_ID=CAMNT_0049344885 /DNA_START=32 /DNA_END=1110 /DNA_ORIENTATION=+
MACSSSRIIKISSSKPSNANDHPETHNSNVSNAPASYTKSAKVRKITPTQPRKRQKWNDRFHIETDQEETVAVSTHTPFRNDRSYAIPKRNIPPKTVTTSNKSIPPIDIITGQREWGKRPKKRAKWKLNKNDSTPKYRKTQRMKWKKPIAMQPVLRPVPKEDLRASRHRVLPLSASMNKSPPKRVHHDAETANHTYDHRHDDDIDINVNDSCSMHMPKATQCQKPACAKMFASAPIAKPRNLIKKESLPFDQKSTTSNSDVFNEAKTENCEQESVDIQPITIQPKPASPKLTAVNNTNRTIDTGTGRRNQYLEPLDEATDIILEELIREMGEEMNLFCSKLVDVLIDGEIKNDKRSRSVA